MRINKVEQVAEFLVEDIRKNGHPPGTQIESVRQIARRMDISPLTASRAVAKLVRDGWLKTQPGRGCFVAAGHDHKPSGPKPRTVGALLHVRWWEDQQLPPSFSQVLERVHLKFMSERINVLSTPAFEDPKAPEPFISLSNLTALKLDALLSLGVGNPEFLARLRVLHIPIISADINATALGLDSVFFDQVGSSAKLVRSMIERGCRKIAFIGGPFTPRMQDEPFYFDPCAVERLEGWRAGLMANGIAPLPEWVMEAPQRSKQLSVDAIKKLFTGPNSADAVLTEFPTQVLEIMKGLGLKRIPIAGWCGTEDETNLRKQLSACACCDFHELGDVAASMLALRLNNPREMTTRLMRIEPRMQAKA